MDYQETNSLEYLFHPESIALVGITLANPTHWTRMFLDALLEFKFERPLYLVNRKGGEIRGLTVYRSLEEIDGPVDYVISTVPASAAPGLVTDCARKHVRTIHFCTSGFGETGEQEGIGLEADIADRARQYGIRIIGPNSMGLYCPDSRISYRGDFPKDSGPVGLVSQSGLNTSMLIRDAMWRGVRFSKAVSYGNACDLNEIDFLEHLACDPKTRIISMYIEGTNNPAELRRALAKAAKEKTVVLLKGGTTEGGTRASASHTGALAGSEVAWDSLCKQLGIIRVHSLEEMADMLVALLHLGLPRGRRTCLIGTGGGSSVIVADHFERHNLPVPPLPDDARARIRQFTPIAGNILVNPIDYGQSIWETEKLTRMVDVVMESESIDLVVVFLRVHGRLPSEPVLQLVRHVQAESEKPRKPMAVILIPSVVPEEATAAFSLINELAALGMPVFYSYARAARAIDSLLRHQEVWPTEAGQVKRLLPHSTFEDNGLRS